MKKALFSLFAFMLFINTYAQQFGYRFGSEFITLTPNRQSLCLVKKQSIEQEFAFEDFFSQQKSKDKFSNNYSSVSFSDSYGNNVYILPLISVSLKEGYSIQPILNKFQKELSLKDCFESIFYLECKLKSAQDVLQIVNKIDSMDGIKWCQPDMIDGTKPNNTYYTYQWYINNSYGYDINIEPAWSITQGSANITVAVIDMGVDQNHEDMGTCVTNGYTASYALENGKPLNPNNLDKKWHGMACAGIIAAIDNDLGIKGVANGVKILPVNIFPNAAYKTNNGTIYHGNARSSQIANAIRWASQRADVLSCSWGGGSPNNDIKSAIQYALQNGRGGKGCVVVFSSGNDYQNGEYNVAFPANVEGVIAVGSINDIGNISNFSQRGNRLDVVAPGESIYTTDRMDSLGYNNENYCYFAGTSFSCPQVSGIAALMLSANSSLSASQIREIIQKTAQDLGPLGKDSVYGYGLVDAYAAVCASKIKFSYLDAICNQETIETGLPSDLVVALNTNYSSSGFSIQVSSNLSIVSYSNGSLTIKKVSDGKGSIKIYYKGNLVSNKEIWVGAPVINDVYYMGGNIYIDTDYEAGTDPRYCYIVINGIRYRLLGGMGVIPLSNGTYNVEAYVSNQCGESSHYFGQITITGSGLYSVGSISNNNQVTIENAGNIDSSQPIETSGAMTGKGAITVPYTLSNAQTGEVAAKGEMPIEGGVLDFGSVHGGLYVLTLLPQSSEPETFKIQLK